MLPPEILFHRYFQQPCWQPLRDNTGTPIDFYRGKQALERVEPEKLGELLAAIQEAVNEGFNEARYGPEHMTHPPFHFDYIDCDNHKNAWAGHSEGYAFIGITLPLVLRLWDLSSRLSRLGLINRWQSTVDDQEEWPERLRVTFFRTAFRFVAMHEWTHHVHGHVEKEGRPFSESSDETASLEKQLWELDADDEATYYTLENLYNHQWALDMLQINDAPQDVQDELLASCFVVGAGAVMFPLSSGPAFDAAKIFNHQHPPHAARMIFLMHQANRWRSRRRPESGWIPAERFRALMEGVARVAFETNPAAWDEQMTFLISEAGLAYITQIDHAFTAYKRALPSQRLESAMPGSKENSWG
jgi:hypothetical protein